MERGRLSNLALKLTSAIIVRGGFAAAYQ